MFARTAEEQHIAVRIFELESTRRFSTFPSDFKLTHYPNPDRPCLAAKAALHW
jgi:hypothetical protein